MADVTITRESVENILANMLDPETGRSLARMDQIRQINIDGRGVEVTLGPHNVVEPPLGRNAQPKRNDSSAKSSRRERTSTCESPSSSAHPNESAKSA